MRWNSLSALLAPAGRISSVFVQQYVVNQCRIVGHVSHASMMWINTGGRITSAVQGWRAIIDLRGDLMAMAKLSRGASVFYFECYRL